MKLTAEGNADVKTLLIVCYDFPWVWKKFYTGLLIEWVSTLKIRWYIIVFLTEDFKNINNQKNYSNFKFDVKKDAYKIDTKCLFSNTGFFCLK